MICQFWFRKTYVKPTKGRYTRYDLYHKTCIIRFLYYTSVDTEMCCPKGKCGCQYFIIYALRFYFPYLSLLAQPVNITLYGPRLACLVFNSVRNGTCIIILDKKYNIANSSCHFGSYDSIWTGLSPKKYCMDL